MDHEKLMDELDRILNALGEQTPGSPEYATLLKQFNELQRIFLAEDRSCEEQVKNKHAQELELKRLALDEKRYELDCRKLALQEREAENKLKIEEMKASAGADETVDRARYSRSQAMWRLVEIGAQGVIMIAGIIVTGKLEETSILSSKAWSLIGKPKV